MKLTFTPIHVFRETPAVTFFDASVAGSNASDVVHLERAMGALELPIDTYHRSVSGPEGSLVLNQPEQHKGFNVVSEFQPVSLRYRDHLRQLLTIPPWVWCWRGGHICRDQG
ncbi:MAG: hypothetical protein QUV06_11125 [Cyanobium sp. CZS 48M]|nr:hypothetical protein [Cyanobium sp. CZS48M]